MDIDQDRFPQIEVLQGLMDRLTSPDLTLGEAKRLHPQLLDLLATLGGDEGAQSARGGPFHRVSPPTVTRSRRHRAGHDGRGSVTPCPAEPRS